MNLTTKRFLPVFAAMVLGLVSSESQGATVTAGSPANATGDWLQNWTGAVTSDGTFLLPDAAIPDTAIINQGRTIEVTAPVSVNPGAVIVGNTASGQNEAILNVNAGGDLTMTGGTLTISADTDAGTVNVQGGTLTTDSAVTVQAGGTFNLSSGSFTNNGTGARPIFQDTNGTGGALNISGGTLTALGAAPSDVLRMELDNINISGGTVDLSGGQVLLADTTTLTITGDAASIQMDRLNMNTATRAATVNFNFGPTGISPINNAAFTHLIQSTINIDGSNYVDTGLAATFDLINTANLASAVDPLNLSITGFGVEGVDYTFEQSTTANIFRLNILGGTPPERFARIDLDGSDNSLINGSFEDVTLISGLEGTGKIQGSSTSFDAHDPNVYAVAQWAPAEDDPNKMVGQYGNSGSVTTDSFYLDNTSSNNAGAGSFDGERGILMNSAGGYVNKLVNEDILSQLTIDPKMLNPNVEIKVTADVTRRGTTLGGDPTATATLAITSGTTDPDDVANAIAGGSASVNQGSLSAGTTEEGLALNLTGADLHTASQLNLVIQTENGAALMLPETTAGQDLTQVSQILFDNIIFSAYLPGDTDGDFDVDADDLAAYRAGYGTTGADPSSSFESGDFDGDGDTDGSDFLILQRNFTGSLDAPALAAVPEPSSFALLLGCLLPVVAGKRQKQRAKRLSAA